MQKGPKVLFDFILHWEGVGSMVGRSGDFVRERKASLEALTILSFANLNMTLFRRHSEVVFDFHSLRSEAPHDVTRVR